MCCVQVLASVKVRSASLHHLLLVVKEGQGRVMAGLSWHHTAGQLVPHQWVTVVCPPLLAVMVVLVLGSLSYSQDVNQGCPLDLNLWAAVWAIQVAAVGVVAVGLERQVGEVVIPVEAPGWVPDLQVWQKQECVSYASTVHYDQDMYAVESDSFAVLFKAGTL